VQRPSPDEYQPPLTRWGHAWRLVGMALISSAAWGPIVQGQWEDHRPLFWLDVALGLVCYVLVFWRRRWPLAIALVTGALSTFSGLAAGPAVLTAVSMATRRRIWELAAVGVVNVIAGQSLATIQPVEGPEPFWLSLILNVVLTAGMLGWGMYIGSRRELMWTLRARAERAEAEQELRIARARGTERAQIAREMHDVLAHRISQISLHAGALGFRDDLTAEEMRVSAAVIREKAHEALTDLRGVLGVLRDSDTGEPLDAPQPTYADVPRLVEEERAAGGHVEYEDLIDRDGPPVPDAVGRTLYRIVQEGITNARKHAPGALLTIRVTGSAEDGIDLVLRNPIGFGPSRTPGAGLGLIGLAERADLRGGWLEHHRDGSTFVLHGWIPWAA
jgi:signal transduction histidine kinase